MTHNHFLLALLCSVAFSATRIFAGEWQIFDESLQNEWTALEFIIQDPQRIFGIAVDMKDYCSQCLTGKKYHLALQAFTRISQSASLAKTNPLTLQDIFPNPTPEEKITLEFLEFQKQSHFAQEKINALNGKTPLDPNTRELLKAFKRFNGNEEQTSFQKFCTKTRTLFNHLGNTQTTAGKTAVSMLGLTSGLYGIARISGTIEGNDYADTAAYFGGVYAGNTLVLNHAFKKVAAPRAQAVGLIIALGKDAIIKNTHAGQTFKENHPTITELSSLGLALTGALIDDYYSQSNPTK